MNIKNNPFYILKVSCTDNRSVIVATAATMRLMTESNVGAEAQHTLLHPTKRLAAELDWFIDADHSSLEKINHSIEAGENIPTDGLGSLSRLNATLFHFSIAATSDLLDLEYTIRVINQQYAALDITTLSNEINECREKAQMAHIVETDIPLELSRKRDDIRQLITEKLQTLDKCIYISFVTRIAQKSVDDAAYLDGVIMNDIIDQYEIRMQSDIEDVTARIKLDIKRIKMGWSHDTSDDKIRSLVEKVKEWDKLVQPLQLTSMMRGMPHQISKNLGNEIRDLALYVNNQKGKPKMALVLAEAMKEVFAELQDLSEAFSQDAAALTNIEKGKATAKKPVDKIEFFKLYSAYIVKCELISIEIISEYTSLISAVNQLAKFDAVADVSVLKNRENLCCMARNVVIALYKKKHMTNFALIVATTLQREFADIPSMHSKLRKDLAALRRQGFWNQTGLSSLAEFEGTQRPARQIGRFEQVTIRVVLVMVFVLTSCFGMCLGDRTGKGASEYTDGFGYTRASKETSESEKSFSQHVENYDSVYVDVVSITPSIGIRYNDDVKSSDVVCECTTSAGTTVWIYMPIHAYHQSIDPLAEIDRAPIASYETVRFSSARRIYGTARLAESKCDGLSKSIGAEMLCDFHSMIMPAENTTHSRKE